MPLRTDYVGGVPCYFEKRRLSLQCAMMGACRIPCLWPSRAQRLALQKSLKAKKNDKHQGCLETLELDKASVATIAMKTGQPSPVTERRVDRPMQVVKLVEPVGKSC